MRRVLLIRKIFLWCQRMRRFNPFSSLFRWSNRFLGRLGVVLMMLWGWGGAHAEPLSPLEWPGQNNALSNYRLGPGDVVTIRVFGEDELSRERVKLTDAGTVPYPVLGEIKVKGLTVGDLERRITEGLRGKYLVDPRVAVFIDEYRPFYINGMVGAPGGYSYQPGLTVLKAAALAGGFKERASMDKIYIIRSDDPGQRMQHVQLADSVYPGDIITVQESFF